MADIGGGGRDDAGPHGAGGAGNGGAPHTGTTIVACAYEGGVVLGADGRVSTGNYISNRASNKIMALSERCYLLRSGSAADTQAVGDFGEGGTVFYIYDDLRGLAAGLGGVVCMPRERESDTEQRGPPCGGGEKQGGRRPPAAAASDGKRDAPAPSQKQKTTTVRLYAAQLEGERGFSAVPTVASLANLVSRVNYNNKAGLVGAMIVAGWDDKKGGQVFGCPIGGTLAPAPAASEGWATDGSGSTYIWGYLDAAWKPRMTRQEAQAFVVEALALAMARDGSSGGVVRLVTVDKHGAAESFLRGGDVPLYGDELAPPNAGGLLAAKGVGGGVDAADVAAILGGAGAQTAAAAAGGGARMVVG